MEEKLNNWLTRLWDWIDERDIDKHFVSMVVLYGTVLVMQWAFGFVDKHMDKPSMELAALILSVTAPYTALQAAVIKWYFNARPT